MLISTDRTLALRCPSCGRLDLHCFTAFNFSGKTALKITCSCGFVKGAITEKEHRSYLVQLPCLICETCHSMQVRHHDLWRAELVSFSCPHTGLELGFVGDRNKMESIVESSRNDVSSLISELALHDYFINPDVMFQALKYVYEIAGNANLYCQCGNSNIEVDVYPDKLELKCPKCDSLNIVYAETQDDLEVIKNVEAIELVKGGFNCIDASKSNTKKKG